VAQRPSGDLDFSVPFNKIGPNAQGVISMAEFRKHLDELGLSNVLGSEDEADKLLTRFDTDHSGTISLEEYKRFVITQDAAAVNLRDVHIDGHTTDYAAGEETSDDDNDDRSSGSDDDGGGGYGSRGRRSRRSDANSDDDGSGDSSDSVDDNGAYGSVKKERSRSASRRRAKRRGDGDSASSESDDDSSGDDNGACYILSMLCISIYPCIYRILVVIHVTHLTDTHAHYFSIFTCRTPAPNVVAAVAVTGCAS
jgi:hypothetical protein